MASDTSPPRKRGATAEAERGAEAAGGGKKKAKTAPVAVDVNSGSYQPTLSDVQNLILRTFTEEYGENPRWLCIRGMGLIRTCYVTMIPCLDKASLLAHASAAPVLAQLVRSPGAIAMRSAAEIEFFPKDQAADFAGCRLLRTLLSARARPAVARKKQARAAAGEKRDDRPRPPLKAYLASAEELARSGFPGEDSKGRQGWVSTAGKAAVSRDLTEGVDEDLVNLVALDCEMVMTASGSALARVSLVSHDGSVLYNTLVQPAEEVTDYLTPYSGITKASLIDVLVTLADVQTRLLELLSEKTILVGHSLENDLKALQMVHERVIDTSLLYPHPRGWPHRQGLAGLSSSVLKRKLDRNNGHDSIADAKVALELVLLKLEKGADFGTTAGASAPLGALLRSSSADVFLAEAGGLAKSGGSAQGSAWHETGCTRVDLEAAAKEADAADVSPPKPQRSVHLTLLRTFEEICASGQTKSDSVLHNCLSHLDARVADIALNLAPDELLILMNGCGDLHEVKQLEGKGADSKGTEADRKQARKRFKDAWGIFAVGGPRLCSLVVGAASALASETSGRAGRAAARASGGDGTGAAGVPAREPVTYDL